MASTKSNQKSNKTTDDDNLCFICTEPTITYSVGPCDHRTCHKCTLRLRALYETRNCAYCKTEQKSVIFTNDSEKSFASILPEDTPYTDKRLGIYFETQAMYRDALHMLEHNCPKCGDTSKDWAQLKQHVRKVHNLNICDLCAQHKKIFPSEHFLYTTSQLTLHTQQGDKSFRDDDETGFAGHPECAFCRIRFYGDDELFVHCRDQHEQCFICVRQGRRHEYYANYANLEKHFGDEHYICTQQRCLEKKFVVFETDIDLRAHEAQEHPELGRKQLDLHFKYESYRDQKKKNKNRREENSSSSSSSGSNNRLMTNNNVSNRAENDNRVQNNGVEDEFPSMTSIQNSLPRHVPGASVRKKKGKEKAIQKPAGFGTLSENNNDSGGGKTASNSSTSANDPIVAQHTAFLSKLATLIGADKIDKFRYLTSQYRKSTMSCENYVNEIVVLANNDIQVAAKIFKGVEDLMDIEDKKWELIRVWRNKQTAMMNFPALEKTSRVLVIKGPTKQKRNVWDKAAASSRVSSVHSSPQSSRSSSPVLNKTPWASSGASVSTTTSAIKKATKSSLPNQDLFPALPKAVPKHQLVLDVRKSKQGSHNAWSSSSTSTTPSGSESEDSTTVTKKKKGRKTNVLFRVGL